MQRLTDFALFRALRGRPFALLWTGQTLSRTGDFLYQVALAWWVLEETGSAAAMATVLIFTQVPMLLFLLLGGVAVDRLPRVPVMLISDLVRGGVMAVVAGLEFAGRLELWQIYLASLIFGFVDAFFQPAYLAAVPALVTSDDLPSANSLSSLSIQTGRILGPAFSAGLLALGGAGLAFALNGLSFFVSAVILLPLLRLPQAPPAARDLVAESAVGHVLADLREGFRTVLVSPWLWISITMFALTNVTLAGPYSVAMPFLVKDFLNAEAGTLGLLYAIFPIGYVLGGAWLGRSARIRHRGLISYIGLAIAGLMLGLFGVRIPLAALVGAALINGAALEMGNLAWINSMQELVPNEKLGRVSSIDMLGSFVLLPLGFALTGWATEQIGPALVFVIGGGITALLALLALAHPAIRRQD